MNQFAGMSISKEATACVRGYLRDAITRATNEGINAQGGVTVVDAVQREIIARRNLAGQFRRNTRVVPDDA